MNLIACTIIKISYFRMKHHNALNASCDFNSYLVCHIQKNTIEVELKIKTTQGKYILNKDTYIRRERHHPWDRADSRGSNSYKQEKNTKKGKL